MSPGISSAKGPLSKIPLPASATKKAPRHSPGRADVRRFSLAPTRQSPLATPPLRKTASRLHASSGLSRSVVGSQCAGKTSRITVAVRKRPVDKTAGPDVVQADARNGQLTVSVTRAKLDGISRHTEAHSFFFDRVFDETSTNRQIYSALVHPLVDFALNGGTSTCFAYGQTGSGKTHTMFHEADGMCFLAARDLLGRLGEDRVFRLSFYEIYQGQLLDLLRQRRKVLACEQRDGTVNILGLSTVCISQMNQLQRLVAQGLDARITGATGANAASSRSHALLHYDLVSAASGVSCGRISFVDLAGSERGADRADVGTHQTKAEGSEINKSLLALKECIRAMDLDSAHLPFRQSRLTLVLRDSLIGTARTCMIATVSPAAANCEHSLNTLRYADRMKEVGHEDGWIVSPINKMGLAGNKMGLASNKMGLAGDKMDLAGDKMDLAGDKMGSASNNVGSAGKDKNPPESRQMAIKETLESLWTGIVACHDPDVLELLQEELSNLAHAFFSLSSSTNN